MYIFTVDMARSASDDNAIPTFTVLQKIYHPTCDDNFKSSYLIPVTFDTVIPE